MIKKFIIAATTLVAAVAGLLTVTTVAAQALTCAEGPGSTTACWQDESNGGNTVTIRFRANRTYWANGVTINKFSIFTNTDVGLADPAVNVNALVLRNGCGNVVWSRYNHNISKAEVSPDPGRQWDVDQYAAYCSGTVRAELSYTVRWAGGATDTGNLLLTWS